MAEKRRQCACAPRDTPGPDARPHVAPPGPPAITAAGGGAELPARLPDLVEEERAAMRQLHPSDLRRNGTGKRAALVAEELGLDQSLRDRRAIERNERAR